LLQKIGIKRIANLLDDNELDTEPQISIKIAYCFVSSLSWISAFVLLGALTTWMVAKTGTTFRSTKAAIVVWITLVLGTFLMLAIG
jgi:hypothetical protein